VVVGLVESSMARLRLVRVPQLLVTATLLAGFAVVLVLR
jgi:formate hydrogenlyase subunit 4